MYVTARGNSRGLARRRVSRGTTTGLLPLPFEYVSQNPPMLLPQPLPFGSTWKNTDGFVQGPTVKANSRGRASTRGRLSRGAFVGNLPLRQEYTGPNKSAINRRVKELATFRERLQKSRERNAAAEFDDTSITTKSFRTFMASFRAAQAPPAPPPVPALMPVERGSGPSAVRGSIRYLMSLGSARMKALATANLARETARSSAVTNASVRTNVSQRANGTNFK